MQLNNGFTIESIDPTTISECDLKKIHEIEQDTWSHHLGEYVKCTCCNKIHSKQDIFGHVSKDVFLNTVSQIEQILGMDRISCTDCGGDTKHIFGEDYIEDIRERYNESTHSFLSVYKDENGEIIGFIDGYIESLETIYKREFEEYYSKIGLQIISEMVTVILNGNIPDNFLTSNVVAIESKYSDLKIFFNLIQHFYLHLDNMGYGGIIGIYESLIGNTTQKIYSGCGANMLGISQNKELTNLVMNNSDGHISDIFIHKNVVESYTLNLRDSPKKFFKKVA